jgi:hypothetical protein
VPVLRVCGAEYRTVAHMESGDPPPPPPMNGFLYGPNTCWLTISYATEVPGATGYTRVQYWVPASIFVEKLCAVPSLSY